MKNNYKNKIIRTINKFILPLEDINSLSIENVHDEQLNQSFDNIKNEIFKGISNIKRHIQILLTIAEWEKLNISFFGETNAGKSTIIESLRNGDGRSIGEGYKDFTKTVNIISYKNINLMDMPGIEGIESKVIKNIHKAIDKSHIIFYVIGTNKEPEETTIRKIKKLLKDDIKVYTILNLRGKPTIYKYKKELRDKNSLKIEERVKNKFQIVLNNNYFGHITINGYLSLLKNDKLQNRFIKDRLKAIEIFDTKNEISNFSNLNQLNKIIDDLSYEINDEIKISNTYKFLDSLGIISGKILREKKRFDIFIRETNALTDKYINDIENIVQKYEIEINNSLDNNISRLKIEIKEEISNSIEEARNEYKIKNRLEKIKNRQSKKLNNDIKKLLNLMKNEIEGKAVEFKNRMSFQMNSLNFKGDFNLKEILKSMELNFKYVMGQILDIGLAIEAVFIAFAINPIIGIITGILAFVRKIWDWFFYDPNKKNKKAKQKAIREVDNEIKKVRRKIQNDLERELFKLNKNAKKPVKDLANSMKGVKRISYSIDNKISNIKKTQIELSQILIQELLRKMITFSYIDLKLSEVVIIGYEVSDSVKKYLLQKLRVKKLNVYSTYSKWLNNIGRYNQYNDFFVNDEFSFRAVNALLLYNPNNIKIRRVQRNRK